MDHENEQQANARARLEEWLLPEEAIPLRPEVARALRIDGTAKKASRGAAAKFGTGGVVVAMTLVGYLEKEGERLYERGEGEHEEEREVARRLRLSPAEVRRETGMKEGEERAACWVLERAGVLEIRKTGHGALSSREDAGVDSAVGRWATLRDWSRRVAENSRAPSDTRRSR